MTECQEKQNNQTVSTSPTNECVELENHSDSILALDLDTGRIQWYHQVGGYDVFFIECFNLSTPGCPPGPNPHVDGEAPMMLSIQVNGTWKDIVVAVPKSGFAWALDPYGPVDVANDVVFAGSTHPEGPIYAMDAKTSKNLWLYETRATVYGGMSVSDGCIYLSNGYTVNLDAASPSSTSGTSLFAFCV
ncbi:hypothetical protein WN944_005489 [Citrus x changshan-huyou]|uniref:Uncharacterized protein n=1 Tax=Citrus x changshan-huyou TaxID=2935761 RepID=A0AAP0M517_9ROSI